MLQPPHSVLHTHTQEHPLRLQDKGWLRAEACLIVLETYSKTCRIRSLRLQFFPGREVGDIQRGNLLTAYRLNRRDTIGEAQALISRIPFTTCDEHRIQRAEGLAGIVLEGELPILVLEIVAITTTLPLSLHVVDRLISVG